MHVAFESSIADIILASPIAMMKYFTLRFKLSQVESRMLKTYSHTLLLGGGNMQGNAQSLLRGRCSGSVPKSIGSPSNTELASLAQDTPACPIRDIGVLPQHLRSQAVGTLWVAVFNQCLQSVPT